MSYHNAPYTLLETSGSIAANKVYQSIFWKIALGKKDGDRVSGKNAEFNNVFFSDGKVLCQDFGLLLQAKGSDEKKIWSSKYLMKTFRKVIRLRSNSTFTDTDMLNGNCIRNATAEPNYFPGC